MTSSGSMTTEAVVEWLTHFSRYKGEGPANWWLTGRHHTRIVPQWKLLVAMILHYYTSQVRLFKKFNYGQICLWTMWALLRWIGSAVRNLARFSLKHGIDQPHQPTFKQHSMPLASIPSTLRLLPTNVGSQVL
jgi:hypothetical protein